LGEIAVTFDMRAETEVERVASPTGVLLGDGDLNQNKITSHKPTSRLLTLI